MGEHFFLISFSVRVSESGIPENNQIVLPSSQKYTAMIVIGYGTFQSVL